VETGSKKADANSGSVDRCLDSDFEEIFSLLQQLWPSKKLDRGKLRTIFSETIRTHERVVLSAKINRRLVGYASMTLKNHLWHGGLIGWIDELVVNEAHRGLGIGRLLLDRLTTIAIEKDCCALELDSAFHRLEAHAFYEKAGFEKRAFLFSKSI
jgi:GNAT superfamily N-acetyltransferase